MILEIACDIYLNNFFYIVKNILNIIMIVVPILLIFFGAFSFIKLVKNPEEKKGNKRILNQFIAAGIVFFIPIVVNAVMALLGEKTELSSCWNNADEYNSSSGYYDVDGTERKKYTYNAKDYEQGVGGTLDFTCTSSVVKAQFSCETLKIVEAHLYDLNAQNFYSVINSYGGFENYAKSLGGIFGEYYGKKIEGRTEADFQVAAEYVLGWMFMYGWDYAAVHTSLDGVPDKGCCYAPWGLTKHTPDAFYVNGGFRRKYVPDWPDRSYLKQPDNTNFDHVISGQNGVDGMASECGDLINFTYSKLGIKTKKAIKKINRLKDLRVGDQISYLNTAGAVAHVNMVGEVYSDRIVLYDGGRYMQGHLNYKREIYFPSIDSKTADDAAVNKVVDGMPHWIGLRFYNFEVS